MQRLLLPFENVAVTSTAKTVITATAPANQRIKCAGFHLWGEGSDPAKAQMRVELCRIDATGTATTFTPVFLDGEDTGTPAIVAKHTYTVEPTTVTLMVPFGTHEAGSYFYREALDQDMISSVVAEMIGLRVTSPDSLDVNGAMWIIL